MSDKNVTAVCEALQSRAEAGLLKYGCTTERTDLSYVDWLLHLRNELLDAAVYTQRLIHDKASEGPDYYDGHDWEGFAGGCDRMGCIKPCADPYSESVRRGQEMRAKYEAWQRGRGIENFTGDGNGAYLNPLLQTEWDAWQAATLEYRRCNPPTE